MGKVVTEASMSLDGHIAKPDNTIGALFDWLQNGEVVRGAPKSRASTRAVALPGPIMELLAAVTAACRSVARLRRLHSCRSAGCQV